MIPSYPECYLLPTLLKFQIHNYMYPWIDLIFIYSQQEETCKVPLKYKSLLFTARMYELVSISVHILNSISFQPSSIFPTLYILLP